ncbi:ABC transporter permease [Paenibacillus tundrae]|uniref:ABC transport system permease protein n=1 Tax=Paenibacillus tundrae TaxID=528187 RepID=A0ABT9W849_9BACL|nr:ABC transporter permease [Paenibacillus tundrae]MDQ0169423.1 putative ABC transport system permease protein [Paenibacillus tundrae]
MRSYTGLTGKYVKVQKKRSLLTIFGIILSVTLLTSIGTMGMSYWDKTVRQTIRDFGNYHVSMNNIPGDAVNKIENNTTVGSAGVASREGYAIIRESKEKEKKEDPNAAPYRYLNVKGYDAKALDMLQVKLDSGRLPTKQNEIILSASSLSYFPVKPQLGESISLNLGIRKEASTGKELQISGLGDFGWGLDEAFEAQSEQQYTVVGYMKRPSTGDWSSRYIFPAITYDDHQNIDQNKKYFVYVQMKSLDHIEEKTDNMIAALQLGHAEKDTAKQLDKDNDLKDIGIEYNNELLKLYGKSTYEGVNLSLSLAIAAVIAIVMISTIAVIYNTFHISVLERISQFGMLRCIGATPAQIRKIVLQEAALLSLIGIPIGLLMGTLFMKVLFYNISLIALGFLNDMRMVISVPILIVAALLGLLSVYFSAIGPAKLAARVSPLEALKSTGKVEQVAKVKTSHVAQKLFGIIGQFASRNLKRNKKRFRITALSMIISIVLFIVFSGLVDFMRQNTQVSGAQYSYSLSYDNLAGQMDDMVYEHIAGLDAVDHAYKFYNSQVAAIIPEDKINPEYMALNGGRYVVAEDEGYRTDNNFLTSYGDNGLEALEAKLVAGKIDKDTMNQENGVIVQQRIRLFTDDGKEKILDQTEFKVGDHIRIRDMNSHGYQTVTVVGIVNQDLLSMEYNSSQVVTFITTPKVYKQITGHDDYSRIFILANPKLSNKPITDYLQSLSEKDAGFNYNDHVTEIAQAHNDAMTLSIILYGFIGVIVVIALLNIVNTVSTNLILRTKEFAVLKAIGMTQRELKKMIILEGVFYGLFAATIGTILGTVLHYGIHALFSGAVDTAWSMPWLSIGIAFVGAVVATLLATIWPLHRLNRVNIVEALRTEN